MAKLVAGVILAVVLTAPLDHRSTATDQFGWFLGSWKCSGPGYVSVNTFSRAPGSRWIANHWGPKGGQGGVAYIGFVPAQRQWIYEDFHDDGGYAQVTSPGLKDGSWTWTGPYYTPEGTVLHGRIVYAIESHDRYDRIFERPAGSGFQRTASDTCRRF